MSDDKKEEDKEPAEKPSRDDSDEPPPDWYGVKNQRPVSEEKRGNQ